MALGPAGPPGSADTEVSVAEADGNRTRRGPFDPPPVLKTGEPTRRSVASERKSSQLAVLGFSVAGFRFLLAACPWHYSYTAAA